MDIVPDENFTFSRQKGGVLLIACGALGKEIVDLIGINHWQAMDVQCLPAIWHNSPEKIPAAVRRIIHQERANYRSIFVLYGDCGTGGLLDKVLEEEGVERIAGPHCYAFFTGNQTFAATCEDDITAFYLTDYLARHFDHLIWRGLGIEQHRELLPLYFGNYQKLVYLAQTEDQQLIAKAKAAAAQLGLEYEYRFTGYGDLATAMEMHNNVEQD